jgi:carbon monoxide dehydrogenase subunit G
MRIKAEVMINKKPEMVWDYAIDWKRHEKWVPNTVIEITHKPDINNLGATGTSFIGTTNIGPYKIIDPMVVMQSSPPVSNHDDTDMNLSVEGAQLYHAKNGELTVTKSGRRIRGTAGFILTPKVDNLGRITTHVEWWEDVEFNYPVPSFIKKQMYKVFQSELKKVLERMKSDIEGNKEKAE